MSSEGYLLDAALDVAPKCSAKVVMTGLSQVKMSALKQSGASNGQPDMRDGREIDQLKVLQRIELKQISQFIQSEL